MAKLDLPPTLLPLLPLAVLLSLLARPTTPTTRAALLVPASTEEQTATIPAAVFLVCLHEETIAREGTTLTPGPTLLATALPTLTLLARLLGEFSLSLSVLALALYASAFDLQ